MCKDYGHSLFFICLHVCDNLCFGLVAISAEMLHNVQIILCIAPMTYEMHVTIQTAFKLHAKLPSDMIKWIEWGKKDLGDN